MQSYDKKLINLIFTSTGRSGSTYLRTLLSSHPDIKIDGEFLYQDPTVDGNWLFFRFWSELISKDIQWISPNRHGELCEKYFQHLAMKRGGFDEYFGIDLKLEQLYQVPWMTSSIFDLTAKFIVIKRSNVLKQVLSEMIMQLRLENSIPPHDTKSQKLMKVVVDPQFVLERMRFKRNLTIDFISKLKQRNKDYFVVVYESFFNEDGSPCKSYMDSIVDYLGLNQSRLVTSLAKQNPYLIIDIVDNYGELREHLFASEFEYTLYF